MKNNIVKVFSELKEKKKKAVIIYYMAGYPHSGSTADIGNALLSGGIPLIELGVPFSDPVADGPVIQSAGNISLKNGTNLDKIFKEACQKS